RLLNLVAQLASQSQIEALADPNGVVSEGEKHVAFTRRVHAFCSLCVLFFVGLATLEAVVLARQLLLEDVEEAAGGGLVLPLRAVQQRERGGGVLLCGGRVLALCGVVDATSPLRSQGPGQRLAAEELCSHAHIQL